MGGRAGLAAAPWELFFICFKCWYCDIYQYMPLIIIVFGEPSLEIYAFFLETYIQFHVSFLF